MLSLVTTALGIGLMLVGDDSAQGAMIALVGIIAGVLLARMVEETTKRATTSAILGDIARMDTTTPMGSGDVPKTTGHLGAKEVGADPVGDVSEAPERSERADDVATREDPGSGRGEPSSNGRVD